MKKHKYLIAIYSPTLTQTPPQAYSLTHSPSQSMCRAWQSWCQGNSHVNARGGKKEHSTAHANEFCLVWGWEKDYQAKEKPSNSPPPPPAKPLGFLATKTYANRFSILQLLKPDNSSGFSAFGRRLRLTSGLFRLLFLYEVYSNSIEKLIKTHQSQYVSNCT